MNTINLATITELPPELQHGSDAPPNLDPRTRAADELHEAASAYVEHRTAATLDRLAVAAVVYGSEVCTRAPSGLRGSAAQLVLAHLGCPSVAALAGAAGRFADHDETLSLASFLQAQWKLEAVAVRVFQSLPGYEAPAFAANEPMGQPVAA